MKISRLSAIHIATNYPDNILIDAHEHDGGKFAGFIYLMRNSCIHRIIVESTPSFNNSVEAEDYMQTVVNFSIYTYNNLISNEIN